MDPDVFDLVYEGFWDLYMMKEKCDEAPGIKKKTFLNRFIMQVASDGTEEVAEPEAAVDEDGNPLEEKKVDAGDDVLSEIEAPKIPDVAAIVRIRIPKKQPEPELDEEGNEIVPEKPIDEDDLDEIECEDKAFSVPVNVNGQQVW